MNDLDIAIKAERAAKKAYKKHESIIGVRSIEHMSKSQKLYAELNAARDKVIDLSWAA